jgi:hypothetical protein
LQAWIKFLGLPIIYELGALLLSILFVILKEVLNQFELGQIAIIIFYAIFVTIGFCLQIAIGFQIAKLAPANKLINAIVYNGALAFIYALTLNLLLGTGVNPQYHLILLFFCFSLGLLIYYSEHKDEFDLGFLNK